MAGKQELSKYLSKLEEEFGGREGWVIHAINNLIVSGQPCDITTYSGKRYLDVKINPSILYATMYGAGPYKIRDMLDEIKLEQKGKPVGTVSFKDIWIISPMPPGGLTQEQLDRVDIAEGETILNPPGISLREMIRKSYYCKDEKEVDYFLRRYLAA